MTPKTKQKLKDAATKAESQFDVLWAGIGNSPFTLGLFVLYSLVLVGFGFWVGLKP